MTASDWPLESDAAKAPAAPLAKYRAALQRYFRKRAPPGEVDDLVQDVFVRLCARRASDPIQDLERYLFRVATTVLVERHRKAATEMDGHRSVALDLSKLDSLSPERIVIGAESLNRILAALERLPPRTREAFILHRFEDMTYDAIARQLGVSPSGVEKLMMRALSHLMTSMMGAD